MPSTSLHQPPDRELPLLGQILSGRKSVVSFIIEIAFLHFSSVTGSWLSPVCSALFFKPNAQCSCHSSHWVASIRAGCLVMISLQNVKRVFQSAPSTWPYYHQECSHSCRNIICSVVSSLADIHPISLK